jgi:hypothetical protein
MSMLCRALGHAVPCFPNDNIHYFRSNLRAMSNKRKNSDTSEDSGSSKQARLSFATDSKTEKDENAMDTSSNVKRLKNGYPVSDSQEADLTWGHDDAELYTAGSALMARRQDTGQPCLFALFARHTSKST